MIVREMKLYDVPQVATMEREIFSQPWSEQGFADSLSNPNTLFLVAEEAAGGADGRAIAGYVGMYQALDEGEITNVAVENDFRRRGIGRFLMEELQKRAAERGVTRIVLEVRASNAPAIRLYEQMNFCRIGTRKGFYDFPKEDADIMLWELEK